jgi:hypothetical protein
VHALIPVINVAAPPPHTVLPAKIEVSGEFLERIAPRIQGKASEFVFLSLSISLLEDENI